MLLSRLQALDRNIKVTIIGIGSIGKGLVYQTLITPGIKTVAICDKNLKKAIECVEWLKKDYEIVNNLTQIHDVVSRNKIAVTDDGVLASNCEFSDILIESSNAIYEGAMHALNAIEQHKHVVMMNFEADLTYGPYLMLKAKQNQVVYTACDGDQPTVIKRLIDDIEFWGFEIVMAGNMKGYLDRYTDPTKIRPEAEKRNLDYKMCASYTDGTKLCVEMAVLANALGFKTSVPGMHGPRMKHINEVFDHFDFDKLWQEKGPLVDYVLGAKPKGGVFVIGYTINKFQRYTLDWFPPEMGPGPFYVFYRPYHLGHIEALNCVAEAFLDNTSRLQPEFGFQTNVFAYAKKDLKMGDMLDGMGGYNCYGLIENQEENIREPGIPICLAEDVFLKKEIKKDQKIKLADVSFNSSDLKFDLYRKAVKCAKDFKQQDDENNSSCKCNNTNL